MATTPPRHPADGPVQPALIRSGAADPAQPRPDRARGPWNAIGRVVLLALGLALAGWIIREIGEDHGLTFAAARLRGGGWWGEALFVLVGAGAAAAGAPRQAVAFLGGSAFGVVAGGLLSLLAQVLGCALDFLWARLVGREWAARRLNGRFGRRLKPVHDVLVGTPFGTTLALRLLPVGNNLALNLLAGLSGVRAAPFILASAIGYVPQTAVFALLGEGVAVDRTAQLVLGGVLFALSAALGWWLLRRHRAGRALEG